METKEGVLEGVVGMNGFNNVYKGKTVLITGHTGFKGSWLTIWLHALGAKVIGYSLPPYSENDNFVQSHIGEQIIDLRGDIRDRTHLLEVCRNYKPEYIFHLAAQPLVRTSYEIPVQTYEVNVLGTINVLECMRHIESCRVGIFITTDKCYENKEQVWGYRENDAMGGYDPYSSSKGAAEIAIQSWRCSYMNPKNYNMHQKAIASVRAGNVIGGGDWAKDRILPDCIRALQKGEPIELRNPQALRPWQFVLEPLSGYLLLGQRLTECPEKYSEGWNFGPSISSVVSVEQIAKYVTKYYGSGEIIDKKQLGQVHEAEVLNLDISKSALKLGWYPTLSVEEAVKYTVEWYKHYDESNIYDKCITQIEAFIDASRFV